jgi:hypothetical protein
MKLPILDQIKRVDLGVRRPTPAPFVSTPYFEAHNVPAETASDFPYEKRINYSIGIECHMYVSPGPEGHQQSLEIVRRQVSELVYKDVLRELKILYRELLTSLHEHETYGAVNGAHRVSAMISSIENATQ